MNKTSKFLAFMGILASLTTYLAFKVTRNTSVRDENSSGPPRNPNHNSLRNEKSNSFENRRNEENTKSPSDDKTQLMYKDLGMTEDQSRRFERDYQAIMGDWEKTNPGIDMDNQQKEDSHVAALKAVLNEAQFAMYREGPYKKRS
ncbi:hypothetical protein LX77_01466 [Gelidibacter algens]|jgi:hypothetical protein|uniref:Uncharacterized protein n=1 Tax=Gelidibacter algens TaxID=49280 RepID=A0A1A7R1K6_9FLAO|nr:hypothetical protein [Gelidibacter algens]OBX25364.1 hypothetical protein A9996_10485 [Gelidibacter algens]RAJ25165.1 hypothetical protein LX77_01466 [Gelidibacter algens]